MTVPNPVDPPQPPQPEPTPAPTPPPSPAPAPSPETRTFTQDEVTAMMTREHEAGRRQAAREISEKLGCTVDEAEQYLQDMRTAEDARLSEAERRERDAEERERRAEAREREAAERERRAAVREALQSEGCRVDRLDLAVNGVMPNIAADADDDAVGAEITRYKEQVPEWFAPPTGPKPTPSTEPTPQPQPPGTPQEDRFAAGSERAKAYKF